MGRKATRSHSAAGTNQENNAVPTPPGVSAASAATISSFLPASSTRNKKRGVKHSSSHLPSSFSFSVGGWLKMYLFGVTKFLQEHGLAKNAKLAGSSAGALAAAALALGCDMDEIREFVIENCVKPCHSNWLGAFKVREYLKQTFEGVGNLHNFEDVSKRGTLEICITALPSCGTIRESHFESPADLCSALIASCCATPIAGLPFKRKGVWVIDGGVAAFQPYVAEDTVLVSPFYCSSADIKPSRYVPLWWAAYPPSPENIEWLFELGYHDAREWAESKGYVPRGTADRKKTVGTWKGHFGRVLGYKALESQVMDLLLVITLFLVWKPVSLALLYTELMLRAVIKGGSAALFGLGCVFMFTMLASALAMAVLPLVVSFKIFAWSCGAMVLFIASVWGLQRLAGGVEGATRMAKQEWKDCSQCLRSMTSLSLLLRTVPFYGSKVPLGRELHLKQYSFVYRVVMHYL